MYTDVENLGILKPNPTRVWYRLGTVSFQGNLYSVRNRYGNTKQRDKPDLNPADSN